MAEPPESFELFTFRLLTPCFFFFLGGGGMMKHFYIVGCTCRTFVHTIVGDFLIPIIFLNMIKFDSIKYHWV